MSRNEAETRAELIDPALQQAGWGIVPGSIVKREYSIAPGHISSALYRDAPLKADYLLTYKNTQLVVIEAKAENKGYTEGLQQAKHYGELLYLPYVASTNGKQIRWVDMITGEETDIENYPTPDEVWQSIYKDVNEWRDYFQAVPFYEKPGEWTLRYYQSVAVNKTLDAIANNQQRILLTLATGTGKTDIAFQIAWKLYKSNWTLSKDRKRSPRILFLADRIFLADQAYNKFRSHGAYPDRALIRIRPEEIRKTGSVPKNGSVFFTIFQTLNSGSDEDLSIASYYGNYSNDFFDVIFIDECHRGGANDESEWREILEYFSPALQIGLTATPKRRNNIDTYAYFGEPVYTYSLKMGINDGFLTPYRLKNYSSSIDDYVLQADDIVLQGEAEVGQTYTQNDLNNSILIKQREESRVIEFLKDINSKEKTLVFCANQERARFIRDMFNTHKTESDPNYCVRVTADDGVNGERMLLIFQDNEKLFPVILTTSEKLSTGIDAHNVRHIVFFRQAHDIIEFKQIIGRGTRLFDSKKYFTIHDFVGTSELFNDPEWDGNPIVELDPQPSPEPTEPESDDENDPADNPDPEPDDDDRHETTIIQLSDGTAKTITYLKGTSFLDAEGKLINAHDFIIKLYGELPSFFSNEEDLREQWSVPSNRQKLLAGLEAKGFPLSQLHELRHAIEADNCDIYDVLAFIMFESKTHSRLERAEKVRLKHSSGFDSSQQDFVNLILNQYVKNDFTELDREKLPELLKLQYHTIHDAYSTLGNREKTEAIFLNVQQFLYED
jgi:type I restriction enzyme R subunit